MVKSVLLGNVDLFKQKCMHLQCMPLNTLACKTNVVQTESNAEVWLST